MSNIVESYRKKWKEEGRLDTLFSLVQKGIVPVDKGAEVLNVEADEFLSMMTKAGYSAPYDEEEMSEIVDSYRKKWLDRGKEIGKEEGRLDTLFSLVQEGKLPVRDAAETLNVEADEFLSMMTKAGYRAPYNEEEMSEMAERYRKWFDYGKAKGRLDAIFLLVEKGIIPVDKATEFLNIAADKFLSMMSDTDCKAPSDA